MERVLFEKLGLSIGCQQIIRFHKPYLVLTLQQFLLLYRLER